MQAYVSHTGAWLPWDAMYDDEAGERLAQWIDDNVGDDEFNNRVVMTPQKTGNAIDSPPILAALARNAPWVSARSPGPPQHGLFVAAWPLEANLQHGIERAHDATLIVFPWGDRLGFDGWAAAVGAFNAATGESTQPLAGELDKEFRGLLLYSNELGQSAQRGEQRRMLQTSMSVFKTAGLSEDFVVTYCLGLGYRGNHQNIRNHYRAARP